MSGRERKRVREGKREEREGERKVKEREIERNKVNERMKSKNQQIARNVDVTCIELNI